MATRTQSTADVSSKRLNPTIADRKTLNLESRLRYDRGTLDTQRDVGKSNLMDAVSFVLRVRSGHLRGAQLKDLIYAMDDREREQRGRRAFVRLIYRHTDSGFENEIQFTRTITGQGGSKYRIDNRVVT